MLSDYDCFHQRRAEYPPNTHTHTHTHTTSKVPMRARVVNVTKMAELVSDQS